MSVQYLFNSSGEWIAFRIEKNVFDSNGNWIGWLPWGDDDVVDTKGKYLGTINTDNRLYHFSGKPYRGYPGYPGYPGIQATLAILVRLAIPHYQPVLETKIRKA